jgi:hypothetical protein
VSDLPPPSQPYRSAAIVHGLLAAAIVLVAWLSNGGIGKALAVAAAYFVLATGWTWFRFRQRERQPAETSSEPRDGNGGR